jgi:phosphate:Na+ symporter
MKGWVRQLFFGLALIIMSISFYFSSSFEMVAAGVAVLLFGMMGLEDGFRQFSKGPLEKIVRKSTDKIIKSISLGFFSSAILQSSSLISVITISFLSAGLMSLTAGIGIIYGANIGTTTTAWIVALFGLKLKISAVAFPLIVFGIFFSFQGSSTIKGLGRIFTGLGFFFLGIQFMKDGFDMVQQTLDLTTLRVSGVWGILAFCGIGIVLTVVLQSSSAAMAVVLTSLYAGQIGYLSALALAVGANIGTTITAIIGSLKSSADGKRLALAHLIFNVSVGVMALIFILPLKNLVDISSEWIGIATNDYTLKLAVFHTVFNSIGVLIMLPIINPMSTWLSKRFTGDEGHGKLRYLNNSALIYSSTALESLQKESRALFELNILPLIHDLDKWIHHEPGAEAQIQEKIEKRYEDSIKPRYGAILQFSVQLNEADLSETETQKLFKIRLAARRMIELVKLLEEISPNLEKYCHSHQKEVQTQYNALLSKLIAVADQMQPVIKSEQPETFLEWIKSNKKDLRKKELWGSDKFSSLFKRLTTDVNILGSLVNDHTTVNQICLLLLQIAELLYIHYDELHQENP